MGIQNFSFYLENLLHHQFDNENDVRQALNAIYSYVNDKHDGRCTSKKLFIENEREKMISKFCHQYFQGIDTKSMCQTKIMRKFAKHNHENDQHNTFIFPRIVNSQINRYAPKNENSELSTEKEVWIDPRIQAWLFDFYATILSPQALADQKAMLAGMPKNYHDLLTLRRSDIGKKLEEAAGKNWLTPELLVTVANHLSTPKSFAAEPAFEKDSIEDYFLYQYQLLISCGDQYKDQFLGSLRNGLINFSKDPRVTKKPYEKTS